MNQYQACLYFIWMHFSLWFQIWSWNSTISTFFYKFGYIFTCFLHSPAAWKALMLLYNSNTLHTAIGFTIHTKSVFCFSKFSKFHTFPNQYQVCLYLFECISLGDTKDSHQITKMLHFWKCCETFDLSSAAHRVESINTYKAARREQTTSPTCNKFGKKWQHSGIWLIIWNPYEKMYSKEFKHAWYWLINSWNRR